MISFEHSRNRIFNTAVRFAAAITAILFCAQLTSAQEALKTVISVAVLPFKSTGNVAKKDVESFANLLRDKMKSLQVTTISDIGKMEKVVTERRMSEPDCFQLPECLRKIGNDLDADFLISGQVEESYGIVTITLQPFDVYHKELWSKTVEISTQSAEVPIAEVLARRASEYASKMYAKRPPPRPTTGVVVVTAYPNNVSILLDNTKQNGTVPLRISNIAPGRHEIKAQRENAFSSAKVDIKAGDTIKVNLVTASWLSVDCNPQLNATVYIDGKKWPGGDASVLTEVLPGAHHLRAINSDSAQAEDRIEIKAGDTVQTELVLKPTLGCLSIATTPAGAAVFLDKTQLKGVSPLNAGRLKPGSYTIRAIGIDSASAEKNIELKAGDSLQLNLVLKPFFGSVSITTVPPGMSVWLDNTKLPSVSPSFTTRLKPSLYTVRTEGPDSSRAEQKIEVKAGDTTRVNLVLKPTRAIIAVTTEPAGAVVFLDTVRIGESPVTVTGLKPGNYRLHALGRDSARAEQNLVLKAGDTANVRLSMKSTRGVIMVTTVPSEATVFMDSIRFTSPAPLNIPLLRPGTYRIRAANADSSQAEQNVELKAGDTVHVNLVLKATRAVLTVTTDPPRIPVFLDEVKLSDASPVTAGMLKPGSYAVRAVTADNAEMKQKVELKAGDTTRVKLTAKATKGAIAITTVPPGALIYVDTVKQQGVSPLTITKVDPGSYRITALGKDSARGEAAVGVNAGDTARVSIVIKPVKAAIVITTTPAGAAVFIDNVRQKGVSPLTISGLKPSTFTVRALTKDSAEAQQTVELKAGDTVRVGLTLKTAKATLTVATAPAGASIYLDTVKLGVSPLSIPKILPGNYTVRAIGKDSSQAEQGIEIKAGDTVKVTLELKTKAAVPLQPAVTVLETARAIPAPPVIQPPAPGFTTLIVGSIPQGAAVLLDSEELPEKTPTTLIGMPAGRHIVTVVKDGVKAESAVELVDGDTAVVNLTLALPTGTAPPALKTKPSGSGAADTTGVKKPAVPEQVQPAFKGTVAIKIETNPVGADLYVQKRIYKWSKPRLTTPVIMTNPGNRELHLTLINRGFRDTTITIAPSVEKSLILKVDMIKADSLDLALEALRDRGIRRFKTGMGLVYVSAALLSGSAVSYLLSEYDYRAAIEKKHYLERSVLDRTSDSYNAALRENRKLTDSGKAKAITGATFLGIGAGALGMGIYLIF